MMNIIGHRHTAIVVEDLETMLAFYLQLGFACERRDDEHGDFISHLIDRPGTRLESVKLRLQDGYRLELIKFIEPVSSAPAELDIARRGIHHLAFTVSDIDQAIAIIVANGGKQISTPRGTNPGLPSIHAYVLDCERNIIHLAQNVDRLPAE